MCGIDSLQCWFGTPPQVHTHTGLWWQPLASSRRFKMCIGGTTALRTASSPAPFFYTVSEERRSFAAFKSQQNHHRPRTRLASFCAVMRRFLELTVVSGSSGQQFSIPLPSFASVRRARSSKFLFNTVAAFHESRTITFFFSKRPALPNMLDKVPRTPFVRQPHVVVARSLTSSKRSGAIL